MPAKLYFKHGPMNSGKSMFLLAQAHNFKERGVGCIIMKPSVDTRDSSVIRSRAITDSQPAFCFTPDDEPYQIIENEQTRRLSLKEPLIQWVLVDEAQFLTPEQVDSLGRVVDILSINVMCYGLRTDFQMNLFPGSKRLFEIADKFEEMKSTCSCGRRAVVNARLDSSGKVLVEGSSVECGAEDKYITLCRNCYYNALVYGTKFSTGRPVEARAEQDTENA